jgi:hypothetical protein
MLTMVSDNGIGRSVRAATSSRRDRSFDPWARSGPIYSSFSFSSSSSSSYYYYYCCCCCCCWPVAGRAMAGA